MTTESIYFDNNATTRIDPKIAQRMFELQLDGVANPASQHRPGRGALRLLEDAKSELLNHFDAPNSGMDSARVILTSGGTEANNLAIRGYTAASSGTVIVAATEHPSVLSSARELMSQGRCRILPVDSDGICDFELLHNWLKQDAAHIDLVSVMLGNNETGVIQDLKSICRLCRPFGVPVHSDAVQAAGKIDVNMSELGLSAMTVTAHKIHGPVGIGALILLADQELAPLLIGGGQQMGLRPGTEPVVGAVALSMAIGLGCEARRQGIYADVSQIRDGFEASLAPLEPCVVIGLDAPRLPHVSNIAFLGIDRQACQMALDLAGVACSSGSACASGSSRPSPVLTAMGLSDDTISSSIRFSFSRFTTLPEMDDASQIIARVVRKLRDKKDLR